MKESLRMVRNMEWAAINMLMAVNTMVSGNLIVKKGKGYLRILMVINMMVNGLIVSSMVRVLFFIKQKISILDIGVMIYRMGMENSTQLMEHNMWENG